MERDQLHRRSSAMIGVSDYRGRPISRSSSGRWTSAIFIIGVEIAERIAYYGISFNLITYLTGPLNFSTASAAAAVNTWSGVSMLLPLLGAFVADSYLGRYPCIVLASLLYILGLGLLTFSAAALPIHCSGELKATMDSSSCSPSAFQIAFFYISLYLVAFAEGGHKPCVQAFGADQFDESDGEERVARSSFFNWWYFGMNGGMIVSFVGLSYVQDSVGWGIGFGIPCVVMVVALLVFLLGSRSYRCYPVEESSPFVRIGKGMANLVMNREIFFRDTVEGGEPRSGLGGQSDHQTKLVDDVKVAGDESIKEAKGMLRLFPIWASCLAYALVFSQYSTFFNKQGNTMDRRIMPGIQVPSAALQSIISIVVVAFIPIYDRIFVPLARNLSGLPSGITQLQRIGAGLLVSAISMAAAALVETKRIETARAHGLVDLPHSTVLMSILWLLPQYILFGIMDVLAMVGLQEFFYDQVPDGLRSLGLALYLSIFGIGSFISGLLVSVIDHVTGEGGQSWFSNNLNQAHLDYFYWLVSGLSAISLCFFVYFARSYVYKVKEY